MSLFCHFHNVDWRRRWWWWWWNVLGRFINLFNRFSRSFRHRAFHVFVDIFFSGDIIFGGVRTIIGADRRWFRFGYILFFFWE